MRVIIAGSRGLSGFALLSAMNGCPFASAITEVVSGCALRGIDRSGEIWAKWVGVPVKRFPADWEGLGKRAGMVRNQAMADYADALIAVWDGESRGTADMIRRAGKAGLVVYVSQPVQQRRLF